MNTPSEDVFPLAQRRLRNRALLRLAFGLLLASGPLFLLFDSEAPSVAGGGGILALIGLGAAWLLVQGTVRLMGASDAVIRLGADGLTLPPGIATLGARVVPYEHIELLVLQAGPSGGRVIVGTAARVHIIPSREVGGLLTLKALFTRLKGRIGARPGGAHQLERIERGLRVTRRLMSRRARITEGILGLLAAFYLVEIITGAIGPFEFIGGRQDVLLRLGANAAPLVFDGQVFRLVSATVLHAGLLHIYLNGMALLALGGVLERLIGGYRLVIVYVLSALVGSACSLMVTQATLSVGASGAVFGLLGALGALQLLHGRRLPPGIGQSRRWWVVIIALNAALPLAVPQVDFWAHLGGFIAGSVSALVLLRSVDSIRPDRPAPFGVQATAMVLAGTFAAGLALGAAHMRTTDGADSLRTLVAAMADDPTTDPQMFNIMAWNIVIDPEASSEVIEVAREAAAEGLRRTPKAADIRDTHATALFRLGRYDEAVADERIVLAADPRAFNATQLLRFLEKATGGELRRGPGLDEAAIALAADGAELAVTIDPWLGRVQVFVAVRVDGIDSGLVEIVADPPASGGRVDLSGGPELPLGHTLHPLLIERAEADVEGPARWRYWALDDEASKLP